VKEIAQGGQAKFFLAKYLKTGLNVAVKRYEGRGVNAVDLLRQIEMVMNACVGVYFLCDVIGVSVDKMGKVSVVMELMGGDLRTFINSHHELLGYAQQIGIMQAIALGMSQLHEYGLVHKDLKASNILVLPNSWTTNEEGDESLNKFVPAKKEFYFAKVGDYDSLDDVAGTGFWRAPEVVQALRDGSDVKPTQSPAVDVYSFGMVCYEILTVLIPFQGHPLSNYELVL
jgi:serine/threonine protein kinase